jgi:GMP synthase (glutamine-hydrolysing)
MPQQPAVSAANVSHPAFELFRGDAPLMVSMPHVGTGLPADLAFRLVEPLRYLFKDEARAVGSALGLPDDIVWRDPFPGPGLAVRILGEVTAEKTAVLREADAIFVGEIKQAGL